jgi:hypothetical protein
MLHLRKIKKRRRKRGRIRVNVRIRSLNGLRMTSKVSVRHDSIKKDKHIGI